MSDARATDVAGSAPTAAAPSPGVLPRRRTLRAPLTVLVAGGVVLALAVGMRQSFGVFLLPMSGDLGWGREVFALAIALQNIVWGVSQPFVGLLADRIGARPVVAISALVYAGGLYLMSSAAGPGDLYLSAGVVLGFALSGTSFVVILGAVGKVFGPERRSLALGAVSAAGSFGQFVMPPAGQALIGDLGWAGALGAFAVLGAITAVVAAGMRGRETVTGAGHGSGSAALVEAARHRGYVLLSAGFFVCGFQITFILGHLPAYFIDVGLTPATAATALGFIGLFNIVGSMAWGAMGGHLRKKNLLASLYAGRVLIMLMLVLVPPAPWVAFVFTSVMGLLWLGTIPLTSALIADVFGSRHLTALFGLTFFGHQVGAFLGVWVGGYVFDSFGGYEPVWWASIAMGIAATVIHLPIDDRPVYRLPAAQAA